MGKDFAQIKFPGRRDEPMRPLHPDLPNGIAGGKA